MCVSITVTGSKQGGKSRSTRAGVNAGIKRLRRSRRIALTALRTIVAALCGICTITTLRTAFAAPPNGTTPASTPSGNVQYLVFEGGGPDEGPGPDAGVNIASLKATFGANDGHSRRQYAYGVQEVRILTRSTAFLRAEIESAFDRAEREDVPLFLHIDPLYGWGADEEARPEDAPGVKFWNDPQMREWAAFPTDAEHLPTQIPRLWFNWGPWCSPAPAFPALGSPRFVRFAAQQLREGVAVVVGKRLKRLKAAGKGYLFAGINVGWETNIADYRYVHAQYPDTALPAAEWPLRVRGLRMQPWEARAQLGYASLFWQGWTEQKLAAAAQKRGIARDTLFDDLCYHDIHDYLAGLARVCVDAGIPRTRVLTHIVAMASVSPQRENTGTPPIWTAVNADSVPGFTMDNGGAAVYNLAEVQRQITAADPTQTHFAVSESYLFHYPDEASLQANLAEAFDHGATVKCVLGALPFVKNAGGPPQPEGAVRAIRAWLTGAATR